MGSTVHQETGNRNTILGVPYYKLLRPLYYHIDFLPVKALAVFEDEKRQELVLILEPFG